MITDEIRVKEEAAMAKIAEPLNWGKWGPEDELGTLNYVTQEKTLNAIRLVREGRVYALSHEIRHQGGSPKAYGRPDPRLLFQYDGADWATGFGEGRRHAREATDDTIEIAIHGTGTHVDALSHYWTHGQMYNGFSGSLVNSFGAQKLGVENMRHVVTRGVLLDVAKYRGVPVMDGFDLITADDIIGCADAQGVALESGDAVLFHTGFPSLYFQEREEGYRYPPRFSGAQPGLGPSAALLMAELEASLVGADNLAVNWIAGGIDKDGRYLRAFMQGQKLDDPRAGLGDPSTVDLHAVFLKNLGLYLLELVDLAELAKDEVHEFLFVMAPLLIRGATGSPVNPLAVV